MEVHKKMDGGLMEVPTGTLFETEAVIGFRA
jgi:hypothetical protein